MLLDVFIQQKLKNICDVRIQECEVIHDHYNAKIIDDCCMFTKVSFILGYMFTVFHLR